MELSQDKKRAAGGAALVVAALAMIMIDFMFQSDVHGFTVHLAGYEATVYAAAVLLLGTYCLYRTIPSVQRRWATPLAVLLILAGDAGIIFAGWVRQTTQLSDALGLTVLFLTAAQIGILLILLSGRSASDHAPGVAVEG